MSQKANSSTSVKNEKIIHSYFLAMSNFYGVIPIRVAIEIITEQNCKISEKEIIDFAKKISKSNKRSNKGFYIVNPSEFYDDYNQENDFLKYEIVEESVLVVDEEEYYDLVASQGNKPFFVPNGKMLLRYKNDCFFEKTPEIEELEKYLKKYAKPFSKHYTLGDVIEEFIIYYKIQTSINFPDIQFLLDRVEPKKEIDEEKFLIGLIPLVQETMNNTRLWVNRGYTPTELANLFAMSNYRS